MKNSMKKFLALSAALVLLLTACFAAAYAEGDAGSAGDSAGGNATEAAGDSAGDSAGESAGEVSEDSAGDSAGAPAGEGTEDSAGDSAGESAGDGEDSAGDSAGLPAGGQEFAVYSEIAENAGVVVENGEVRYTEGWNGTVSGEITPAGMKGAVITANEANGAAIALAGETDTFVIEDSDLSATAGQKNNEAGYEAAFGVAVTVRTGELWIRNSRLSSDGPRSAAVYMHSTFNPSGTSLVVVDSEINAHTDKADIWMPPFKLLAGGSRATLLMTRNNSWFINSRVTSNNWGAISQDTVDATTYVINSRGMATEGGYGTYLTNEMKLYASQLYGGQYGAFMCGKSLIETGGAEDALADEAAMSKTPDYEPRDEQTVIAGAFNAVAVHNATFGNGYVAVGKFRNAVLSTMPEDLPEEVTPMAANDDFFLQEGVSFGVESGSAYFFNRNLYGSLILVRSMGSDMTFDNTTARTSNGVLMQTVITFDPPSASGYLTAGQGEDLPGSTVTFLNGEYEGDILHQDYHRRMSVTVGENSTLRGAVVSGTWQGWVDLWSDEALRKALEEDGYQEIPFANESWADDVRSNLTLADDTAYAETENLGADVTVAAGGTWVVTGTSTLSSLTLEEGASVIAPDGMTLAVSVDADASNALSSYTGGTPVDGLAAGTYRNVIITVTGN